MGMYTRLVLNVSLKGDDKTFIARLGRMVLGQADDLDGRLKWMLTSSSYYHDNIQQASLKYDSISNCHKLTVTCDLKNYEDEIDTFLRMLAPHVATVHVAGYVLYEEDVSPTLFWFWNGSVLKFTPTLSAELQNCLDDT